MGEQENSLDLDLKVERFKLIKLSRLNEVISSARRLCNHLGLYVCMCICVCVYVYVCLSVNTITQKIINIWTSNFARTFAIA